MQLDQIIKDMHPREEMALAYIKKGINAIYSWDWRAKCYCYTSDSFRLTLLRPDKNVMFEPIPNIKDIDWENPQKYIMSPGKDYMGDDQSTFAQCKEYGVCQAGGLGSNWYWNGYSDKGLGSFLYLPMKGRPEILELVK